MLEFVKLVVPRVGAEIVTHCDFNSWKPHFTTTAHWHADVLTCLCMLSAACTRSCVLFARFLQSRLWCVFLQRGRVAVLFLRSFHTASHPPSDSVKYKNDMETTPYPLRALQATLKAIRKQWRPLSERFRRLRNAPQNNASHSASVSGNYRAHIKATHYTLRTLHPT